MPTDIVVPHRQMLHHLGHGPDGELAAQELAAEIIMRALDANLLDERELTRRASGPARIPGDPYGYADAVSRFLSESFAQRVSLEDVAAAVGLSPFHLCRVFQAATATTIHQHLLAIRLEAAIARLLETRHSITEIAHAVGFSSHSHLTALFKRTFGIPPRSLREPGASARRLAALGSKQAVTSAGRMAARRRPPR